jgi:hypothetical protein
MITWKQAQRALVILCLWLGFSSCGKTPTEAPIDGEQPTISLTCNPATAGTNDIISISVLIKNNHVTAAGGVRAALVATLLQLVDGFWPLLALPEDDTERRRKLVDWMIALDMYPKAYLEKIEI